MISMGIGEYEEVQLEDNPLTIRRKRKSCTWRRIMEDAERRQIKNNEEEKLWRMERRRSFGGVRRLGQEKGEDQRKREECEFR